MALMVPPGITSMGMVSVFWVDALAAQAIDPSISEEQGARLRAAIGDAQMTKLVTACGTVNRMVIGDAAFWRRSSGKTPA